MFISLFIYLAEFISRILKLDAQSEAVQRILISLLSEIPKQNME